VKYTYKGCLPAEARMHKPCWCLDC